jgi:hypothetical protein
VTARDLGPPTERTGPQPETRPDTTPAATHDDVASLSLRADKGPDAQRDPITFSVTEYGQFAELMFNLGAEYALMQVHAESEEIRRVAAQVWKTPRYAEIENRRQPTDEPCQLGCERCSRCVRDSVARRNRQRYGQPDFPGAGR